MPGSAVKNTAPKFPGRLLLIGIAGTAAACMGALALLGWILRIPQLASFGTNLIPMAPSTALLFILFGAALGLCAVETLDRTRRNYCAALACLGTLVALILFIASCQAVLWRGELFGLSLNVSLKGIPIGHMSPVTALCFVLAGGSLSVSLISSINRPGHGKVALGIAGLLLTTCAVLLLTYILGLPILYGGSVIPPALPTVLAFTALGIGLWVLALRHMRPRVASDQSPVSSQANISLGLTFCLLVIGITTVGALYFRTHKQQFRSEIEAKLTSVANLQVNQLLQWRKERLGDAAVLFKNPAFASMVRRYFEKPEEAEAQTQLRAWLGGFQAHLGYNRVSLFDPHGAERIAVPNTPEAASSDFARSVGEVMRTRQVIFQDFYRNEHDQRIYLSVLVPILEEPAEGSVIAIVALRVDPETELYPMLNRWPVPSRTAETILVRKEGREVVFLNELRFRKGSALSIRSPLKRKHQPSVKAAMGKEGIVEGADYRGVPAIAASRPVPDSPWFLVARMDMAEVTAPLDEQLRTTVFLVMVMLFGAGAAVGLIWRQQRAVFYREKLEASEALRQEQNLILNLTDSLQNHIYFKDTACRFLRVNPALARILGASDPKEIIGKSDADFFSEERARHFRAEEEEIIRTGEPLLNVEHKEIRLDGTETWALVSKLPLRDASGTIIGTCGITTNITEHKRAEEALRQTGLELQEKNSELGRFLYAASHDLKSPVVTVKAFLGYLKQDLETGDSAQIEKDLFYINTAADKMGNLLDELLEMSRIGRVTSPPVRVTFRTLVDEALMAVAGRITGGGVTVSVTGKDLVLFGDRIRLAEVWQNLLENSCKFLGDQKEPRVEVGVEVREGETVFFVRDNGEGVDPRHQAKVFGLFEKLDPKAEGTGIGLALVKRIVELYGGRIWLDSDGVGQGANFLFTLPAALYNHL